MRFLKTLAPAALMALATAACAGEYPQSSIDPKTDFAREIHGLYSTVTIWSVVILVVVWVLLAYVLIRFRERPDSPRPKQIHGHLGMEIAWTIGPALIVVAIAIPTIQAVFATQRGDPENAMVVDVVGHQFWWEFRYPDLGITTANELHLPVGRPISLRLHSADVIHSFWVPQLGGKRDVNPLVRKPEGEDPKHNWIHFTADEPGTYMGQCAEFCGESHSLMGMRVVVESQGDFDAWVAAWRGAGASTPADTAAPTPDTSAVAVATPGDQAGSGPSGGEAGEAPAADDAVPQELPEGVDPALVAQGREVFLQGSSCVACHAIEGTAAQGQIAPNLTLLGRRSTIASGWLDNSIENLERWIASPRSVKPGVLMPGVDEEGGNWPATNLTEEQVRALAHYLYSLR